MPTRAFLRTKRVRATTDELADAVLDARHYREKIESNRRISEEVKQERHQVVRDELDDKVAKIQRTADKALQRAKEDTATEGLPTHSGKALLVESQKARAWNEHIRPLLDAGRDPTDIATRLSQKGDRLALQTLAANLPGYLETEPQTEAESGSARDHRISNYMGTIRESLADLRTPEEAVAHEALAEVDKAHKIMQTNLGMVAREQEGVEPVVELWRDDSAEPLVLADF